MLGVREVPEELPLVGPAEGRQDAVEIPACYLLGGDADAHEIPLVFAPTPEVLTERADALDLLARIDLPVAFLVARQQLFLGDAAQRGPVLLLILREAEVDHSCPRTCGAFRSISAR